MWRCRALAFSELERKRYPVDILRGSHERHHRVLGVLSEALSNANVSVELVDGGSLLHRHLRSKDVVFSVGGDGTVLKAASKIFSNQVPFIGINSDPVLSMGQLCAVSMAPDDDPSKLKNILDRYKAGRFREIFRSRIRADLYSDDENLDVCGTHHEHVSSPALFALNECFLSEDDPSRPAIIEMTTPSGIKQMRSSGVIVSSASGSTGWIANAGAVHPASISQLLSERDITTCKMLAKRYDRKFDFSSSVADSRLQYFVREPVIAEENIDFGHLRGFAKEVVLRPLGFACKLNFDGLRSINVDYGIRIRLTAANATHSLRCLYFS